MSELTLDLQPVHTRASLARRGIDERGPLDLLAALAGSSVAIVHDYLTQRGGAERVVLALHRALPSAPVHTSLYEPAGTFPEFGGVDVVTSPLDRVERLRRSHRLALPFLARAFSSMDVEADVAICSSSGWAHGVRTSGRKVVYCHAPARWLYQTETYLRGTGRLSAAVLRALAPSLRRWDRRAARSVDLYVANSTRTRDLLREAYGIDAPVVYPPAGVDRLGAVEPVDGLEPGYLLCVSRLLSYKNVDRIVAAVERMPGERLVVVGHGPEAPALRAAAPPNVVFLDEVTDAQLRWLYQEARLLVSASYEDFGLTPIEAAAFGTPTAALRFGGYLDTVVPGQTGVHFDDLEPGSIVAAVRELDRLQPRPLVLQGHAAQFSDRAFGHRLAQVVAA